MIRSQTVAACRRMHHMVACRPGSACMCGPIADCSGAVSGRAEGSAPGLSGWPSSAIWRSANGDTFTTWSPRFANPNGWSMPNRPSRARERYWHISSRLYTPGGRSRNARLSQRRCPDHLLPLEKDYASKLANGRRSCAWHARVHPAGS